METPLDTVILSRFPNVAAFLKTSGLVAADTPVLVSVTDPSQLADKHVVGVEVALLSGRHPLRSFTEVGFELSAEERLGDLTPAELATRLRVVETAHAGVWSARLAPPNPDVLGLTTGDRLAVRTGSLVEPVIGIPLGPGLQYTAQATATLRLNPAGYQERWFDQLEFSAGTPNQTQLAQELAGIWLSNFGPQLSAPRPLELVLVTRWPYLAQFLIDQGVIAADTPVILHVTDPAQIAGKHVIGTLPLSLASLAAQVTEPKFNLSPEDRQRNLTLKEMATRFRGVRTYAVFPLALATPAEATIWTLKAGERRRITSERLCNSVTGETLDLNLTYEAEATNVFHLRADGGKDRWFKVLPGAIPQLPDHDGVWLDSESSLLATAN